MQSGDPCFFANFTRTAGQCDYWTSTTFVAHFDVSPTNPTNPPCSQGFEYSFLRCPAAGVVLRCRLSLTAVFDLVLRVHASYEEFTMPFDHLRNP